MTKNRQSVFLIDDEEIINFCNEDLISGFEEIDDLKVYEDSEIALSYIENTSICDNIPNIWFVDINMPKMNGFQFIDKAVTKLKSLDCNPSIYMLSSSTHSSDKIECERRGYIKGFLCKPLSETHLISILEG